MITVPATHRAGRGEGPGAALFPKQVAVPGLLGRYHGEPCSAAKGASRQRRLRSPRAPSPLLRNRRVPERGRGLARSGPGGAGPGGGRSPVCARPPEHGEGRSSAFVLGRPSPDKRLSPAPRGSGQGCPGLLAWEMGRLQREAPRRRSPRAVGCWVPLVRPPPKLGGVPTGRAGGPTAGSGRSLGRELFLLPRPRSAKRPLLPVRWQLRPPSWLQAPSVLGVLAGRTQKGFLQRRTPQWLLSFIASAREIHVYCNFFFFWYLCLSDSKN